jgi:hypothetical protein
VTVWRAFLAGLFTSLLTVSGMGSALAHPEGSFYGLWWHPAQKPVIWHFEDSFPIGSGDKRDRVLDAISTWEAAAGDLTFDKEPDFTRTTLDCPQEGNSWIGYESIVTADALAETKVCKFADFPNQARSFWLRFDSAEAWYQGASTPPPNGTIDVQAVATHELGHVGGFGYPIGQVKPHWGVNANGSIDVTEYLNLCDNTPYHTMCQYYSPGSAWWRSLETHDLHTFGDQY